MKKISGLLILSLFFFIACAPASHAYVQIFGFKIPSTMSEVKTSFFGNNFLKPKSGVSLIPTIRVGGGEVRNREAVATETISALPLFAEGLTKGSLIITEEQVNKALSSAKGKSFSGYTLENITVDLLDNSAKISASFKGGKALEANLRLVSGGSSLELSDLKSVGSVPLSVIEEVLVKQGSKQAQTLIFNQYPQYKNAFKSATISSDKITIYLSK